MAVRRWGSEQLVNVVTAGNQQDPSVAALADGGYVIAWEDGPSTSVFVARYDAGGTQNYSSFVGSALDPSIAPLRGGGFAMGADAQFSPSNVDPYVRIFNAANTIVGDNDRAFDNDIADQIAIAPSGTGVVAAWHNSVQNGGDILARLITSSAGDTGSIFTVNATTAGNQTRPDVTELTSGRLAFSWLDGSVVRVRTFDAAGANPTAEAVASSSTLAYSNDDPHITALTNGGFVVAFTTALAPFPDTNFGARARIFDPNGVAFGSEIQLNATTQINQAFPDVVALPGGGFLAVWLDVSEGGSALSIRGRAFDAVGVHQGGEFVVSTGTFSGGPDPIQVSAAALSDGRIVVTWEGPYAAGGDTGGYSVHSQIIDPRDGLVIGTATADTLYGHDVGGDEISGLGGNDRLFGLGGDDAIAAGDGNDTVDAGIGNDVVYGGTGDDSVLGGGGDDTITGDLGNDRLFGGAGDDTLSGGTGADQVLGQDGNDTIAGNDDGDLIDGGAGNDTIDGGGGADNILAGAGDDMVSGGEGADQVSGNEGNDVIMGGVGGDLLNGGAGNDQLSGNEDNDVIYGDDPVGPFGDDAINGGDGADSLSGFGGNDTIYGGAGGDFIQGGDGNDLVNGEGGNDFLYGGAGADVFQYTGHGFNVDQIFDFAHAVDKISFSTTLFANAASVLSHATQIGADVLIDAGSGDQIALKGFQLSTLTADDFAFF